MRKFVIYLKNGGKIEEPATCIIVRTDCLGGNQVDFMKEWGYSSLSENDIKKIFEEDEIAGDAWEIFLSEQPHMNTNEFCTYLKLNREAKK